MFKPETNLRSLDFQYDILDHRRLWYSDNPTELVTGGKNWKLSLFTCSFSKILAKFLSKGCSHHSRIN